MTNMYLHLGQEIDTFMELRLYHLKRKIFFEVISLKN